MTQAFVEERLDLGYDYGAEGGLEWQTDIVRLGSGRDELRQPRRSVPYGDWEIGERNVTAEKYRIIADFHYVMQGRTVAFRYKDWNDFLASGDALEPDGGPTVQLRRVYTTGSITRTRPITKPVAGTTTFTRGGASYTPASVDITTGVVTLAKDKDLLISNITAAAPAEVTTDSAHGLTTGETVYITETGLSEIDDKTWVVTVVDTTTISLDGSDTSGTGGASTGNVEQYVQPGEELAWSGEFDVPARFDVDRLPASFLGADHNGPRVYLLRSVPIVEVEP